MSFIEYVIPVFAALAGWLVLGQEVTPATVAGFAFILAGSSPRSGGRCVGQRTRYFRMGRRERSASRARPLLGGCGDDGKSV